MKQKIAYRARLKSCTRKRRLNENVTLPKHNLSEKREICIVMCNKNSDKFLFVDSILIELNSSCITLYTDPMLRKKLHCSIK